jgi:hypothetical protein
MVVDYLVISKIQQDHLLVGHLNFSWWCGAWCGGGVVVSSGGFAKNLNAPFLIKKIAKEAGPARILTTKILKCLIDVADH